MSWERASEREMKSDPYFLCVYLTSFCLKKQSGVQVHPVMQLPAKTNVYMLVTDIYLMTMFY